MKTKMESRISRKVRERSYSSSSEEIKRSEKYTKYDTKEYLSKRYQLDRKQVEKREYYESRKRSYSSSNSDNSESERVEDRGGSGKSKTSSRSDKHSLVKKEKSESSYKHESSSVYSNVKVKDEPASSGEDDSNRRIPEQYRNGNTNRGKGSAPRRNRWNRSRSRDNDPPVKKERFSDVEKEPRWGKPSENAAAQDKKKPVVNVAKPDFGLSGKLTEETNMYNGVVIKYSEPPEARKPKRRWRLYPFKGDAGLPTLYIHRQSAFLIGRDHKVADIRIDHPSCSKQHAALQYRLVPFTNNDGRSSKRICPYIIDLESANGTFVNNVKIEARKYVQLLEKDVIKFAFSSREYVLLHEHSKDSDEDDNM